VPVNAENDHFGTDEKYWPPSDSVALKNIFFQGRSLSFVSLDWVSDADPFTEPLGRLMDPTTVDPGIRER
jgi:hypothetical protein